MLAEQQTEWIINNNLVKKGWVVDNIQGKNVFFQKSPYPEHQKLLEIVEKKGKYKKPDYILYQKNTRIPIGVIEAKAGGVDVEKAIKQQATDYAEALKAPLIFASNNGEYFLTKHLESGKELSVNGDEIRRMVTYSEAVTFINEGKNEIYTKNKALIKNKEELIKEFKKVNDLLRKAHVISGYDRISEFSNILFLKLISEQQGEKSYWNSIKKQDDDDLLQYLNGTVISQLENKYGGGVFSETEIKKPTLLRQIINMIDPLQFSDIKTDIKGDAFEYFLKNMNQADNDLGQYFTPRHIVEAMVRLVDPKIGETIYDPFCGSGGFLISSFNHIKDNSILNSQQESFLKKDTLYGRDATKVSTIAKKNMILHGDGHSNIEEIDSLENPHIIYMQKEKDENGNEKEVEKIRKFEVIITNIPFSLKDADYSTLYYNGLAKRNSDAICVLHCFQALKVGGRMAIIVPEGFLFRKDLKMVREEILSKANLELVISLPQGIFLPYTGVKTNILYFTNVHNKQPQDSYWYYEVKNDGYTLNNNRRKIQGYNDIDVIESSDLKRLEKRPDLKSKMIQDGFQLIEFNKIKERDYNLVGSAYKDVKHNSKYPLVQLADICVEIKNGINVQQDKSRGKYRVSRIESISNGTFNLSKTNFTNDEVNENDFLQYGDILLSHINSYEHLAKTAIYLEDQNTKVVHGANLVKLRVNNVLAIPQYISYVLKGDIFVDMAKNLGQRAVNQASIRVSELKKISIPLPPLEVQKEIVAELDKIQKSIEGFKQGIEALKSEGGGLSANFGNEEVENMRLKDATLLITDGTHNTPLLTDSGIPMLDGENIIDFYIDDSQPKKYISIETDQLLSKRCKPSENDILLSSRGTIGKVAIVEKGQNFNIMGNMILIRVNQKILLSKFLMYYLYNDNSNINALAKGTSQKGLYLNQMRNYQVNIPSLETQQEIVDKLDAEIQFIKQTETMIEKQAKKIQERISALWQENEDKLVDAEGLESELVADKPLFDKLIKRASKPQPTST